ncbi:DDE-domain-containing protein, partial [Macrolepiota fuliginosa MF-IS2]
NRWTDQELSTLWLKDDFEPTSKAQNISSQPHLLILDGHNSHCTYEFCRFATQSNIIVVCLPSHTTHALQPCDMGFFGPLVTAWKAQVNQCTCSRIPITKTNFLQYYASAYDKAFKSSTIVSAFSKTGIYPLNAAIPASAFKPVKLMTTQASM